MIRGVLLDLSGVLYVGNEALPGAIQALSGLRDAGLPIRFVTNVTRSPFDVILARLQSMSFDIDAEELLTAPRAARRYLESHGLHPFLLVHPALAAGLQGILVRTGKYQAGDEDKITRAGARAAADFSAATGTILSSSP